jgi:hypothetical protein
MLRYINPVVCVAPALARGSTSSTSFYYILRNCGGACETFWCIAPKSA